LTISVHEEPFQLSTLAVVPVGKGEVGINPLTTIEAVCVPPAEL
jgi:hypothetical protein